MSAAAIPLTIGSTRPNAAPSWPLVATVVIVGLAFFASGHDLNISMADAYTQNAEEMEITAAGGNSLRRVAFVIVGAWGLALLVTSKQLFRIDPLMAGGIGLVLGLTVASFLWADDPGMCLRRMFALVCCVAAAAGVARAFSLREISWLTLATLGALAAVGVLAELRLGTFRPWGDDYRFAGTVHPNTQGPAMAALMLAAFGLAREAGRGRIWLWFVCAAAFGLLLLTKSRTTAAAIVLSLGAVLVVQTRLSTKVAAAAGLAWIGACGLWMVWVCGFDPLNDFRDAILLGRAEESDTLSGRAFIWPEVMYFANQRLLFGHGYESFWTAGRIDTISSNLGWGLREAHNGYLEVLLSMGVVGLAALVFVVLAGLAASVRAFRATRDPVYTLPIGLIVFGLLNAGLESGMVVVNLVPFLLGCCLLRLGLFGEAHGGPWVVDQASRGALQLVPRYGRCHERA